MIKEFKPKATIQAVQYDPADIDTIQAAQDFLDDINKFRSAGQSSFQFSIGGKKGLSLFRYTPQEEVEQGDWIVFIEDKSLDMGEKSYQINVMSDEAFKKRYQ